MTQSKTSDQPTNAAPITNLGSEFQGLLKVKEDLSLVFQHAILNAKFEWIDAVLVVKDIIMIFRKNKLF